ncbi:MAG TPA: ECF transporter S component [Firmicutes bacterium]|nr:ECF transporter S component [Bacillota bacterium]
MRLSVRQVAVAGMLGALAVLLEVSGIGRIPMPTGVSATTMHIPAILAGCLEGPVVGGFVGLVFGLWSWLVPRNPFFANPLISVVPRILIGVVAALVYQRTMSSILAAIVGTATNTIGVLGLAAAFGYLKPGVAGLVAVTHGIPEIIVAAIAVGLLMQALRRAYKKSPGVERQ